MTCGCGKNWHPGDAYLLCLRDPCPLRAAWQNSSVSNNNSFFASGPSKELHEKAARESASLFGSLDLGRQILKEHEKVFVYDLKGAQSATSTVTVGLVSTPFKTKDLMHSEMVAIENMLENGTWVLHLGQVVWANGEAIRSAQFSTTEPHCGFCTVLLYAAGLPLSKPTWGSHKLASRLSYQLPVAMEIDLHFMARVLSGGISCSPAYVKKIMNLVVSLKPEQWLLGFAAQWYDDNGPTVFDGTKVPVLWDDFLNDPKRMRLYALWKEIYDVVFQGNKQAEQQ